MVQNVGSVERGLRILVGLLQSVLVFLGPGTWWGLVGLLPLLTGALGYCPCYHLIGISTAVVQAPLPVSSRPPPRL